MVFGMMLETYTLVHVLLSLAGIGAGLIVLFGLIAGKRLDGWTPLFLSTTVLTSVTGYGFPVDRVMPSHVVGAISLVVLAVAILARYSFRLAGIWRRTYVVCASTALYLNVFVGVVQAFQKAPVLKALAPTQSEAPFVLAQLTVLAFFVALASVAAVKFGNPPASTA